MRKIQINGAYTKEIEIFAPSEAIQRGKKEERADICPAEREEESQKPYNGAKKKKERIYAPLSV